MRTCKIIRDGYQYRVQVGTVTVDVTDSVIELLAEERAKRDEANAELRAAHRDVVDRYNQIARIVLAGGAGMPTG